MPLIKALKFHQRQLIENANHVISDVAKPCASVGVPATVSKTANIDKSQQSTFMTAPGSTSGSPESQRIQSSGGGMETAADIACEYVTSSDQY